MKESEDLYIFCVTFDSKMTFETHPRLVCRAASQRLGIFKFFRVFHILIAGRCFRGFVLSVLEYCSAVWCSAADTHLKLLAHVVRGVCFLTGRVFECNIEHRRSVTALCMFRKIRCNPMHPLFGAIPVPYAPVRVTHGALITQQYTYTPPRCRTSLHRRNFYSPPQYLCGAILLTLYSMVWDKQGPCFFILSCSLPFCLLLISLSLLSF